MSGRYVAAVFVGAFIWVWFVADRWSHWYVHHVPAWVRYPIGIVLIVAWVTMFIVLPLLGWTWRRRQREPDSTTSP